MKKLYKNFKLDNYTFSFKDNVDVTINSIQTSGIQLAEAFDSEEIPEAINKLVLTNKVKIETFATMLKQFYKIFRNDRYDTSFYQVTKYLKQSFKDLLSVNDTLRKCIIQSQMYTISTLLEKIVSALEDFMNVMKISLPVDLKDDMLNTHRVLHSYFQHNQVSFMNDIAEINHLLQIPKKGRDIKINGHLRVQLAPYC